MEEKKFILPKAQVIISFVSVYALIGLAELFSLLVPEVFASLHLIAKPLIMLSLLAYFWISIKNSKRNSDYIVLGAICFSFFGDMFLMFEGPQYFLLGLGAFLCAQIAYFWIFRTDRKNTALTTFLRHRWFSIPILLFGVAMMISLWPLLGEMQIPVLVYSIVIMLMGLAALDRYGVVDSKSYWKVLVGALLFILSDSIIAYSRFGQEIMEIQQAGFWIMLTYILAQFLIITGWLEGRAAHVEPREIT